MLGEFILQFLRVIGKGLQDILSPHTTKNNLSFHNLLPPSWHWTAHSGISLAINIIAVTVLLSLPSLQGRYIEYQPVWLGLRRGVFTCVGWKVTL